jgi:hypothetical protein
MDSGGYGVDFKCSFCTSEHCRRRRRRRCAALCASNEPSAARAKRVAIAQASKLKQETSHCLLRNGKDH